jgi:hypothetical protein
MEQCYGISTYDPESQSTDILLVCLTKERAEGLIQSLYARMREGITALPPMGEQQKPENDHPRWVAYVQLEKEADAIVPGSGFHVIDWNFRGMRGFQGPLQANDVFVKESLGITEIPFAG